MFFDFEALLVLLTLITGAVWAWDKLRGRGGRASGAMAWWVDLCRSLFPVILAVLFIRSFLVEPFRIPSGSMVPTLYSGDFILVNKFAYGLRLPVSHTELLEIDRPERGDVVVFRYPENPAQDYIKRVVGLPGDEVAYRDQRVYVNGELMEQLLLGGYQGPDASPVARLKHEQLGETEHLIVVEPRPPGRREPHACPFMQTAGISCTFTVPDKHYFVMGDNRDHSSDSRFWGFVPEANLVGEAFLIWMSWDPERYRINWGRIGDRIQ